MTKEQYISVIIPFHNVEQYIEKCAISLLEQTYPYIEYVFINDCSTDSSLIILTKTINRYPKRKYQVKILSNSENKGTAYTRNLGLSIASGYYIGWVDADDWIDSNMYEILLKNMIYHNADLVWCDYFHEYFDTSHKVSASLQQENKIQFLQKYLITSQTFLWNTLAQKDLYKSNKISFCNGCNMWEDYNVSTKLHYFARKSLHIDQALYHYQQTNQKSLCKTMNYESNISQLENALELYNFFSDKNLFHEIKRQLLYRVLLAKQFYLYNDKDITKYVSICPECSRYILSCPFYGFKAKLVEWLAVKLHSIILRLADTHI